MSHKSHARRVLVHSAKLLVALGIVGYLFYRLSDDEVLPRLLNEPKNWDRLVLAQCAVLLAVSLNYIRWHVLVRALELNFTLRDAFRLGSLGLLLNQVSPGSVGGDLFKAVAIAHEQPTKRTEAVASVVIDRVVGLYAMLLVASAGYLLGGSPRETNATVEAMGRAIIVFALVGTAGVGMLMLPAFTGPLVRNWASRLPIVGHTVARLIDAAAAYRHRRRYLFAGIVIACMTHLLLVTSIWLIGHGLPVKAPGLATTFVIGPLSLAAGALPITPSGLGIFEAALGQLYKAVGLAEADGYLVGLTSRVMTYVMAAVGGLYYLSARRQVAEVLHEADEVADELE
jgi:glycosyltransferase 2 family protein